MALTIHLPGIKTCCLLSLRDYLLHGGSEALGATVACKSCMRLLAVETRGHKGVLGWSWKYDDVKKVAS